MVLRMPIGIDDFGKVIEGGFVYVDKTLWVEEVLGQAAEVMLITRPRRFGKTLNMSMLAHFLDQRRNSGALFRGLAIEGRPCFQVQGSFPVLFISFKDLKAPTYELFLGLFRELMFNLYSDFAYLLEHLAEYEQAHFRAVLHGDADQAKLMGALFQLIKWLHQHHGKRVVLLLDEYDSPLLEGYAAGYYDQLIAFMRGMLGRVLKSNTALEKAVLTGILRVAKESIFSDLNNVLVFSLLEQPFADKFGFTEAETEALLVRADLATQMDAVRDWYNGYLMGKVVIYNPWSLVNFLNAPDQGCRGYWVNTSANLLVREQLLHANSKSQESLKRLLLGENVASVISDQTVFRDLQHDESMLWSFLLFSGYLTVAAGQDQVRDQTMLLKVPNREVRLLFQNIFQGWMRRELNGS